jgi:hypothetical protein
MSHDTKVRILMASMAMCMAALTAPLLPAWLFAVFLGVCGTVGLLSPEIEKAWAKSHFWGSDHYWRGR